MVVAQLVEWSLPAPEVHGSNPVMSKLLSNIYILSIVNCIEETKIKEKSPGLVQFFLNNIKPYHNFGNRHSVTGEVIL